MLREFRHDGKLAENLCQCFRIAGACRGFSVVFGELERIGKEESIKTRRGAGATVGDREASQAFFLGTQMKLRKKMLVFKRGGHEALAEIGDGFRYRAHTLFFFRRQKKWTQKRAVDTVAESEVCAAQSFNQVFREGGNPQERSFQNVVPLCGRIGRGYRWCGGAGHFVLSPGFPAEIPGANDWPAAMLLGAPVNPLAAPTPSIPSHRGHGFEASPCRARSMTRRAILSTTCSK